MSFSNNRLSALVLLAAIFLMGCQANQAIPREQMSLNSGINRGPLPSPTPGWDFQKEPQAVCNRFAIDGAEGRMKIYFEPGYTDPMGYDPNKIRLMFKSEPAAWTADEKVQIVFYRWMVSETGSSSIDSTPLNFILEDPLTLQQVAGPYGNTKAFTSTEFQKLTPQESPPVELKNFNFVITGTDVPYQVMRIVLRRTLEGGSLETVQETNALIPAFLANPEAYKASKPQATLLYTLHPFFDKVGAGWTSQNFAAMAQDLCF